MLVERETRSTLLVRGEKVLLDEHLAGLYGVDVKVLNQAVKRNLERFPADFMFQLTRTEWQNLKSQIVTSSLESHGGRRSAPFAYTDRGVAMFRASCAAGRQ